MLQLLMIFLKKLAEVPAGRGIRMWEERDAPDAGISPVLFVELPIHSNFTI